MALDEYAGVLGNFVPNINFGGFFGFVTWIIILLVVIVILSVVAFFLFQRLRFNKKVVIFEKVAGQWVPSKRDVAREVRIEKGLGHVFYLKKNKLYIPRPEIQTGPRTYWMCVREDGELVNFQMGDIDQQMKTANVKYIEKDMRLANASLKSLIEERLKPKNTWKEYAPILVSVAFIALIGIMTWLLFDKWIDLAGTINEAMELGVEISKENKAVLAAIDNVRSGGSGIVSTGPG